MSNELATYGSESRELAHPNETAGTAAASQAKALVEARYVMAIRRPRNDEEVRQRLLKECLRPSFAAVAIYRKPVGQGIEGPSIRFAEAALRMMGNITIDTMTVYDDQLKRIVRVTVTDLEANLPYAQDVTIEKTVERRKAKPGDQVLRTRQNSTGEQVYVLIATDDEILNKQNALISKAIRTQGLRLVPGDLIDEALWQVRETRKKEDAQDPDASKRKIFDAFNELGVTAGQLAEWLGHAGDKLQPKEMSDLRGIYAALRDNETTWREVMDAKNPPSDGKTEKASGLKDALAKKKGASHAATSPAEKTIAEATKEAIAAAATSEELDKAWNAFMNSPHDPEDEGPLGKLYAERDKALRG